MKHFASFCSSITMLLLVMFQFSGSAQSVTLSGIVKDKQNSEPLVGVSLQVKGKVVGTVTNSAGRYSLKTTIPTPFTLLVSYIGYKTLEIEISESRSELNIEMETQTVFGEEVVVAASRVEEKILESPVSIEKMGIAAIKANPAPSFYDALASLKGVELNTQSLTFKSVNTRGFNSNGNTRVVQLIDGMDNQAPGLNFSVGNIVGITELDLENVELLPGAASALYGANAINGIVLLNSKSPFLYQGLSANVKTGFLNESARSSKTTPYYDVAVRYARAINNKFAFKLNVAYLSADDWQGNDFRDQSILNGFDLNSGNRITNPGYEGVNVYGDEAVDNMKSSLAPVLQDPTNPLTIGINQISSATGGALSAQQIFNAIMPDSAMAFVSRTGYNERDLTDYDTRNMKLNAAFHYRINNQIEAFIQGSYGTGTTVYTGADRYSIKKFNMGQYKAELKGTNFYVRAYTTQERAGDSYASATLGLGINEAWKLNQQWFREYYGSYATGSLTSFATTLQTALAQGKPFPQAVSEATAASQSGSSGFHTASRNVADNGRLLPGTPEFEAAAKQIREKPLSYDAAGGYGARFVDKTNLYQAEFMYNFMNQVKFMELLVGGNYRVYDLNSDKTLFAVDDNGEEFNIKEGGGFIHVGKKLLQDQLKLTGSLRFDKNMNFNGQFSPRLSSVYTIAGVHNIRASYQSGFRIPTTQEQYIDLPTPRARLLGGLPFLRSRYGLNQGLVFSLESVQAGNPQPYQFKEFEPEKIYSYEVGYKGLINRKLLIDAYVYFNDFRDFVIDQVLIQSVPTPTNPNARNVFRIPVNNEENIKSFGWALGLDYSFPSSFIAGGNISFNKILNEEDILGGLGPQYNTPKIRFNLYFGNRNISNTNVGFNITFRWQESFIWESSFVNVNLLAVQGSYIPSYGSLDVQVNKFFPKIKTTVKLGGANILNQSYRQAWGNPLVGTTGYISVGYNL